MTKMKPQPYAISTSDGNWIYFYTKKRAYESFNFLKNKAYNKRMAVRIYKYWDSIGYVTINNHNGGMK